MLLFDEPLSNLDAKLRRHVREEIRELQQKLGDHRGLRHPRPGRGAGDLRPGDRDEQRRDRPGGHAARAVRGAGRPVRRRLHRRRQHRRGRDRGDRWRRGGGAPWYGDLRLPQPRARHPVRPCWRSGRRRSCCRRSRGRHAARGEVLKASYLGSHIEYELGTPVGELFAIDADATRMLARSASRSASASPTGASR